MTLQRKKPMRRTPIRRKPSKQGIPKAIRDQLSARSLGRCEAALAGCTSRATDAHHRKLRRSGDHSLVNLVDLCDHCHKAVIHANPFWSYHHGWLVRSTGDPGAIRPIHGCGLDCQIDHYT